jgi:hypothetical protein
MAGLDPATHAFAGRPFSKKFFFEKKNQKTFFIWAIGRFTRTAHHGKRFLLRGRPASF